MRIASTGAIDAVTETIALAFADDPVWGVALAREDGTSDHHYAFWQKFVEAAIPYETVFVSEEDPDRVAAVALWIPPGREEMSEQAADELRSIVRGALDPVTQDLMFALWDRFDEHHPQTPHVYLSLLATHPQYRRRGLAQEIVRENLADFDREGVPTYLESTNPANDHRYERLGYRRIGTFEGASPGSVVSQMWRDVP